MDDKAKIIQELLNITKYLEIYLVENLNKDSNKIKNIKALIEKKITYLETTDVDIKTTNEIFIDIARKFNLDILFGNNKII